MERGKIKEVQDNVATARKHGQDVAPSACPWWSSLLTETCGLCVSCAGETNRKLRDTVPAHAV